MENNIIRAVKANKTSMCEVLNQNTELEAAKTLRSDSGDDSVRLFQCKYKISDYTNFTLSLMHLCTVRFYLCSWRLWFHLCTFVCWFGGWSE